MHITGKHAGFLLAAAIGLAFAQPAYSQSFLNNSSSHSSSSHSSSIFGGPPSGFGATTNGGLPMGGFGGSTFGGSTFGNTPSATPFSGVGMTPAQYLYYSNRNRLTNPTSLAPLAIGGGYYQLGGGGSYWLSPSGYYYPWVTGAYGGYPTQVIYVLQQGSIGEAK